MSSNSVALADRDVDRYTRQIIVPEVGIDGQERILATVLFIDGTPRGVAQARLYASATGFRISDDITSARLDYIVVAGIDALGTTEHEALVERGLPIVWSRVGPDGFTVGVHPTNPLPPPASTTPAGADEPTHAPLDEAAACDAIARTVTHLLGLAGGKDVDVTFSWS